MKNTYLQNLIARRGWSSEHFAALLADFVANTYDVTLRDYMEAQP